MFSCLGDNCDWAPNIMPNLAQTFHALHESDDILILPNAWDAGSAKVIEDAGAGYFANPTGGLSGHCAVDWSPSGIDNCVTFSGSRTSFVDLEMH